MWQPRFYQAKKRLIKTWPPESKKKFLLSEATMENRRCSTIPRILFEIITFLCEVLPIRSVPTFIELLVGAMITQSGFVTQAWLAINPLRTWTSYYKWLQKGKWSWVAVGLQLARVVIRFFPQKRWLLILDDTFVYRSSRKAPGSGTYHQHGNKSNRPVYARGQCWVSLALSISKGFKHAAIPLLSRLMRVDGNTGKLVAARVLLRAIDQVFAARKTTVLMDSWYMKWPLLSFILDLDFHAIGQVRRDTALYGMPVLTGKRGRPAKYGLKYTPERVEELEETVEELWLYGKKQKIHYRSVQCLARFLKGRLVKVVWTQFEDSVGNLRKSRLLLSTDPTLSAREIILSYGKRWAIEDLFNQMKNSWGWRETWQQSRQVLHRWTQILSAAYAIPQLMAIYRPELWMKALEMMPWRKEGVVTAGLVRVVMQRFFGNVRVRDWWNPKCRKFEDTYYALSKEYAQRLRKPPGGVNNHTRGHNFWSSPG